MVEILLQKSFLAIQRNKSGDDFIATRTLSSFLIEALKLQYLTGNGTHSKGKILNSYVLQLTLIQIATCLVDMKQFSLAARCLDCVNSFKTDSLGTEDTQSKQIAQLRSRIKEGEAKQDDEKIMNMKGKKSSFISSKNFNEENDDPFDEGWPDSDDEKPTSGLSLSSMGNNEKLVLKDDDDDWPDSDNDNGRAAPFAGLIDNSDNEDDESVTDIAHEELFPARYRFFKSRDLGPSEKLASTTPSSLLTLKTDDGSPSFKDSKEMFRWLETILTKHEKHTEDGQEPAAKQTNEVDVIQSFQTNLKYLDMVC